MGLEYREFTPSPPVAAYVECFWTLEGRQPDVTQPERVIPDGRAELIWNLADPFLRHEPGGIPRRQAAALLVGQITGPFLLQPTGSIDLLAARFRPAALGPFLRGLAAQGLSNVDVSLEDALRTRLRTVAEEAADARTAVARVAILEARLGEDLRHAAPIDPRVAAAVDLMAGASGRTRIEDVAAAVGLSLRQLERRFLVAVGIGPKRLARIDCFQRLVSRLRSTGAESWAGLAIRCGYYDQAHLIRDFREFTGGTPGEFLGRQNRIADLFLSPHPRRGPASDETGG